MCMSLKTHIKLRTELVMTVNFYYFKKSVIEILDQNTDFLVIMLQ